MVRVALGVVALTMIGSSVLTATALRGRAARALYAALLVALLAVAARALLVPLVRAYALVGAGAQLWSLAAVALVGAAVTLVRPAGWRALSALAGVALVRVACASNVGDLALALALLAFADAIASTGGARRWALVAVVAWIALGAAAQYQLFLAARATVKPAPATQHLWMELTLLMASLALVAVPPLIARAGLIVPPRLGRLIAFARNFGLASWLADYAYTTAHLAHPGIPLSFVFETHLFVPLVVAIATLLPSLALLVIAWARHGSMENRVAAVGITVAFAALWLWSMSAVCT